MPIRAFFLPCLIVAMHLAGAARAQEGPAFMQGSAVTTAEATRTIEITPQTRWVNVNFRESVRFVVGGAEFAWRFDGPGGRAVDLQRVAPAGVLARPLMAYITLPIENSRRD